MRVSQKPDPSKVRMDADALERVMREWPARLDDEGVVMRIIRNAFHTAKHPRKVTKK
jgi:hypothetical protein